VNYHFGSKDELLAEALNFAPLAALQKANTNESPSIRLRLFIRDFMMMLLDESNPSSQCRIMARELADPTPALDKIVREAIAPCMNSWVILCVKLSAKRFATLIYAAVSTASWASVCSTAILTR